MHYFISSFFSSLLSEGIKTYINDLLAISSIICVLFLVIGGYTYITSSGNPEKILKAKKIIKNTTLGLIIVLAANLITNFYSHSYKSVSSNHSEIIQLDKIKPNSHSAGIVGVIIKSISGVFSDIIMTLASPFLHAFSYFISATPLPSENIEVMKLWEVSIGIADTLFVFILVLLGLRLMSSSVLGFGEISFMKILSTSALGFLIMNSSIFIIDSIISISNLMIKSLDLNKALSVFKILEDITKEPSGFALAALIILIVLLVISIILIIYYVARIIGIYLGAILAPIVVLLLLLPSTKDVAINLIKKYFITIFTLFIHVLILLLAETLLSGMGGSSADPIMSMLLGIACLVTLIKTQGVLSQLSYISVAPRLARQFSRQLVYGASFVGNQAMQLASITNIGSSALNMIKNGYSDNPSSNEYYARYYATKQAESIRGDYKTNNSIEKGGMKK